ncbi:MAG: hypothetical protein WCG19_07650 [Chlorobiaceae bacterium]
MAKLKKEEPAVTVNGKKFLVADFTEEAKTQFVNIQAAEAEINRLQVQMALAQTARNAYQQALVIALSA